MKVTDKDVAYVADLANLELTEEERPRMLRDLNAILGYVDLLDELDTKDVAPMAQVSDRFGVDPNQTGSARFAYARRDDVAEGLRKSFSPETALRGAPESDGTFFEVPKVIEK
jgi:aspartyl-tRNA(Asn)/glutamyl-tRNA(Gln) amidotransferase subunit C